MLSKQERPLLSEGRYYGEASASLSFWGTRIQTGGSLDVNITRKPNTSNTFDVSASLQRTSVTPGFSYFFPSQVTATAEVVVDEARKKVTITGTVPVISRDRVTKTVDVIQGEDGSLKGESSLGPVSVVARVFR